MKAKLKAKILEVTKNVSTVSNKDFNVEVGGLTRMKVISKGKVETTLNNAQDIIFQGEIFLKEMIANQMKVGATITITLSDEEVSE